ncbi:hypothetical protein FOFC_06500 [Fusarium oxysporum]|nr:hypothetical protein FOFC_06500 [Fusarium oxysporum]
MTRLVGEAKGMFRWVACQLDYMCELPTDRARREALGKLPPSLYATYDRILLRIGGYDDTVKRLVKKAILMLATSFVSLSFEEICEAISLEEDATTLEDDEIVEEEELLRWCSSLVRVSKSGSFNGGKTRIQFAHFTVKEYLRSLKTRDSNHEYPQLKEYAVSHEDGIDFFSFLCLRFLTMEDIERFPPTRDTTRAISCILAQHRRRTFYEPSVLTWAAYATTSKMGDRTRKLLRKLLHPSETPAFCLWAIDIIFCHHPSSIEASSESIKILSQVIAAVLRPESTPLHMAAAFSMPDACQELLEGGSDLVKAGVSITAQDVQLFSIRYNQYLQMPSFTSKTSQMWSRFPQFFNVLGNNNAPGSPRFILRQETGELIFRTGEKIPPQSPKEQSLDGASDEEVLAYIHSLIELNDETGMNSFLSTRRAKLAQSTDTDPEHPGWNALHLALLERSYRVLDPLLAFGLDPRADRPDGFEPVHMCCRENTCGALQALLRFGVSTLDTDNLDRTVWHLAAVMNSVTVLEELLDLGDVDIALKMTSKPHETPICAAATRLHFEAVCLLLPFCKTEESCTSSKALSLSLYEPRFSEAMQSLHRFGIFHKRHADDVQTCEKLYGLGCPLECELPFSILLTPLALAIIQGYYKVMEWLIRMGAPVSIIMAHPNKDAYCTVLDLFLERPNVNHLLPTLLDAYLAGGGAFSHKQHSVLDIPLASHNTDGLTILLNKLQGKALGQGEVTKLFRDILGSCIFESTSKLDSLSAIINQGDTIYLNRTPLFLAAAQNNVKAVNSLLIHGADVNIADDRNCTPLFVASEHGSAEVVELLLSRGAHVDVMNTSSHEFLNVAFVQKSWKVVDILLAAGLPSNRINSEGRNLLILMTLWTCVPGTKPNIGLFKQLLDHGVDL